MPDTTACVLIPVKSFTVAKLRLADALSPDERAALARSMAERVVAAAAPLPVWCVCEDRDVAAWAESLGASVEWTPDLGLNGAVQTATQRRAEAGFGRVVVAHGDLPFARDLSSLAIADPDEVVLVPDRRERGTNVLSCPTDRGFKFAYGADSFGRHLAEVARRWLRATVRHVDELAWDVDEPDDLATPAHLGVLPGRTAPDGGAS